MSKKELLYFLIENTSISKDKITNLEEIKTAFLNHYSNFKSLNMYVGLFLSVLYEEELIKTEQGYNIKLDVKEKSNKIINGSKGIYKQVKFTEELKELENNIYLVNRTDNIINITTNDKKKLVYVVPNKQSTAYYLGKLRKLESWKN